jgi:hypothetical protein
VVDALGRLARDGEIDLERYRISSDVVGLTKRLYYNVRKMARIIADSAEDAPRGL